ncbi:hypothetical protein F5Y10DRAFT_253877 [Nemania abortiva]|nr:hypothetical protein F5Y10DRAFT_253877 [Nemania abortiva]
MMMALSLLSPSLFYLIMPSSRFQFRLDEASIGFTGRPLSSYGGDQSSPVTDRPLLHFSVYLVGITRVGDPLLLSGNVVQFIVTQGD